MLKSITRPVIALTKQCADLCITTLNASRRSPFDTPAWLPGTVMGLDSSGFCARAVCNHVFCKHVQSSTHHFADQLCYFCIL